MYNYLNFEPTRENIPENRRYLLITKEYQKPKPKDGNKKVTKEQLKEYQDMISSREKMFNKLKVGNFIDMGNRYIEMSDITKDITWLINNEDYIIYKLNPINAYIHSERFYSSENFRISSFNVEKIIESTTDLLDELSNTTFYHDAFNQIFDHSYYLNKREKGIELFKYFNEKYPDKKIYVSDCLYEDIHSYDKHSRYKNLKYATEFVEILYDNGLIELFEEYGNHEKLVCEMIKAGWFKIAVDYIKRVKNLDYGEIYFKDKYKDDIIPIIMENTDNKYIKEIIKLLGIEDRYLTLIVEEYSEDECCICEIDKKQFKDINDARSYVIKEYGVSFEDASKDVSYWNAEDRDLCFYIK